MHSGLWREGETLGSEVAHPCHPFTDPEQLFCEAKASSQSSPSSHSTVTRWLGIPIPWIWMGNGGSVRLSEVPRSGRSAVFVEGI